MKKFLSVICGVLLVGILAISFTSCSKEEKIAPQIKTLKFDIKVTNKTPLGETKAVKTGWATGDKMYVFFNVTTPATGNLDAYKYVTLTYDASNTKWDGVMCGALTDANEIGTAGTMYGIYFPFGGVDIASDGDGGVTFKTKDCTNPSLNGQPIYTYYMTGTTDYTVSTAGDIGTLHGDLRMEIPEDYVYFFVNKNGSDFNSNEKYRLSAQGLIPTACTSFKAGTFTESTLTQLRSVWGYTYNDAGIAFSLKKDATWASATPHKFFISVEQGGTYNKTFNAALPNRASVNLAMTGESAWTKRAFRGYEISKGFLIRNGLDDYDLTPGNDPFEIYNYYGKNENKNKVYFQFSFLKSDAELGSNGDNINATSPKLPSGGWFFPSASGGNWGTIIEGAPSQVITIQNSDDSESTIPTGYYGQNKAYAFVRVTKDAKTYVGTVLLRDGSYIPKECGIQYWGKNSAMNEITYNQLLALIDVGGFFLSSTGTWAIDSWRYIDDNSNVEGNYMSCTYSSGKWYRLHFMNYSSPSISASSGLKSTEYDPVRLVKTIE